MKIQDIIDKRKLRWEEKHDISYDKKLVKAAVEKILSTPSLRAEILEKPYLLIEAAFCIVDKKKQTVPFFLNEIQRDLIKKIETLGTLKPFFVLKNRQQGVTAVVTAIQLSFAIVRKNFSGFTMADRSDNTQAIFNDKARSTYERLPESLKPREKFNSRNELFFDKLNSSWRIATATDNVGRSRTLNFVHFSEVAFYDCDLSLLQAGIGEAITADAIVVYESTANGFNQAKELWDSGACHNIFYAFWQTAEYRSCEYEYLETKDKWLTERKKLLEELGCDKEQITWYCKKYAGYLDKRTIRQEYPITPEEAFISSGGSMFNKEEITDRLARLSGLQVPKIGYFEYKKIGTPITNTKGETIDVLWELKDIRFKESLDGYIRIHEEPQVKKSGERVTHKEPYALGGDTAGTGEDYYTAKVVSAIDERCVATFQKQYMSDNEYAEQMYCLGKYYHNALIGIEINYSRQPTKVLQKYEYPNLYMRERLDKATKEKVLDYGFETNKKTKPIIIGELIDLIDRSPESECDAATLREMLTFVKKDTGEMEAIDGCHDDLVMADAIAHYVAHSQQHTWIELEEPEEDSIQRNFNTEDNYEGNEGYMAWDDL